MIEQFLLDNGWKFIGGCSCGGARQRKYWNQLYPAFKIVVYPSRDKCVILQNNRRFISNDINSSEVEQILKQYGLVA